MANNGSIQFLRGTSARKQEVGAQTTLLAGQPFFETDTNKLYIGNGTKNLLNTSAINDSGYDTVISTQEEFEAWYAQLDAGTYEGTSVLFLEGKYERMDGKGLKLPLTLTRIKGAGNVEIHVVGLTLDTNLESSYALYYDSSTVLIPDRSIENIKVTCHAPARCFCNCYNLVNCYATIEQMTTAEKSFVVAGFWDCHNLVNCYVNISSTYKRDVQALGFHGCTDLINCRGYTYISSNTGNATAYCFHESEGLTNCQGQATAHTEASSSGKSSNGFTFYSCKICSNCRQLAGYSPSTTIWNGTNENVDPNTCPEYKG